MTRSLSTLAPLSLCSAFVLTASLAGAQPTPPPTGTTPSERPPTVPMTPTPPPPSPPTVPPAPAPAPAQPAPVSPPNETGVPRAAQPTGAPEEEASPEEPAAEEEAPEPEPEPSEVGGLAPPQPLRPGWSRRHGWYRGYAPYDGPPVLFDRREPALGAYGAIGVAYTHLLHRDGVLTSLEAAVLIEHRVSLGLAGYAFSRSPRGPTALDGTRRDFTTAYGGVSLRYAAFTAFPVYVSLGVLIGGGVLNLREDVDWSRGHHAHFDESDGYFVVQPDLSLHVNATRWLRFSLTGGYRFASAVHRFGYDATAMSGALVGGNIAFGWF